MIVHEPGAGHRIAIAVVNTCSFGATAFIVVLLTRHILGLFTLVTLGPRVLGTPLEEFLPAQVGWFNAAVATSLVVGALVLVSATDSIKRVAWSYSTALIPLPALAFAGVAAASYRFPGVLLLAGTIGIYVLYLRRRRGLRLLTFLSVAALAVSLAPLDISLQNVPGHVRFVPGGSGLFSREGFEMVERGELVMLGGCSPSYYEPRWVLVWQGPPNYRMQATAGGLGDDSPARGCSPAAPDAERQAHDSMLKPLPFELSKEEFRDLNRRIPRSRGSSDIGKRAIEIVTLYFTRLDPEVQVESSTDPGVDLYVTINGERRSAIEVKGTRAEGIAWGQLKVSGEPSFFALARDKMPIFRVVGVYTRQPQIYHLLCGRDFDLVPEQRWRVRPRGGA